jgi:hypothetical protein
VLLDLQNFGIINKDFSHWKGDEYLRSFATMISDDSRRNEYIYKSRPILSSSELSPLGQTAADIAGTFRRNDGGDEFYVLLYGTIIDGLGYLNRLHRRARDFDDMAKRVLGAPHAFGFRAGLIVLGKEEDFKSAEERVTDCLGRTTKKGSKYLVDWGRVQDDDSIPLGYDDSRFPPGTGPGNILAEAERNFRTEAS